MIQFQILSGSRSGSTNLIQHFPCSIGRATACNLRLEDAGVWDQHLQVELTPDGFVLHLHSPALGTVNGQPFQQLLLRNGDQIEIGSVKLKFWLSEASQIRLRWREALTWVALAALAIGQGFLIYRLLQ